jgi:hypothetical protein
LVEMGESRTLCQGSLAVFPAASQLHEWPPLPFSGFASSFSLVAVVCERSF